MATTLTYAATTLALDDDLLWVDEHTWRPVSQITQFSLTGALLVHASVKQAGRPITLRGGEGFGWLPKSAIDQLLTWAGLPGQTFTLSLRGVTHTVIFNVEAGPLEAVPVMDYSDPAAADWYVPTIRFLKV